VTVLIKYTDTVSTATQLITNLWQSCFFETQELKWGSAIPTIAILTLSILTNVKFTTAGVVTANIRHYASTSYRPRH